MSQSTYRAWIDAEAAIFDYLQARLGTISGVNGFPVKDYPRAATVPSGLNNWTFEISGGDSPNIRSPEEQDSAMALWMLAQFRGRFTSRDTAILVAGTVWDAMPAGSATDGRLRSVVQVQATSYPSVVDDVAEVASDQDTGGLTRVWVVTIPAWVVLSRV